MKIPLCPRTCLRIWSRETGSDVPSRVSLLISILSRLNLVLTYSGFLPSSAVVASIYETAIRHRVSPEFIGSRNCVPMAFTVPRDRRHRASKLQDSSERVLPWQLTMDQLICASLSHTHYWYEVGMLKKYRLVSPRHYTVDPSKVATIGNPFKCYEEVVVYL